MRCFIAVDLPEYLKDGIETLQNELTFIDGKLVPRQNFHFTLKFLGKLDENKTDLVKNTLSTIKIRPFNVTLKGIGFFPNPNFIRVVWIGVDSPEFVKLHELANERLSDIIKPEKPIPHLTLARIYSQKNIDKLHEFAKNHENEDLGSFQIDKIKLKKSNLSPYGAHYEDLEIWDLNDN